MFKQIIRDIYNLNYLKINNFVEIKKLQCSPLNSNRYFKRLTDFEKNSLKSNGPTTTYRSSKSQESLPFLKKEFPISETKSGFYQVNADRHGRSYNDAFPRATATFYEKFDQQNEIKRLQVLIHNKCREIMKSDFSINENTRKQITPNVRNSFKQDQHQKMQSNNRHFNAYPFPSVLSRNPLYSNLDQIKTKQKFTKASFSNSFGYTNPHYFKKVSFNL